MPTLDATVSGTSANSYATVATADTYFTERLQTGNWTGASEDDKERALIMATRRIDTLRFEGTKSTAGAALKWPRQDAFDDDGEEYASNAIPELVKQAAYEEALRILNDDADSTDTLGLTGLEQFDAVKVGPIEVEVNQTYQSGELSDTARRLLRPVMRSAGMMASLERG